MDPKTTQVPGHGGRRRRPRHRVRRRPVGDGPPMPSPPASAAAMEEPAQVLGDRGTAATKAKGEGALRHQCTMDRSTDMVWAELDLRRALFVSVVNNGPDTPAKDLANEIAMQFGLAVETLVFHRTALVEYLLMLENKAAAELVYDGSRPSGRLPVFFISGVGPDKRTPQVVLYHPSSASSSTASLRMPGIW